MKTVTMSSGISIGVLPPDPGSFGYLMRIALEANKLDALNLAPTDPRVLAYSELLLGALMPMLRFQIDRDAAEIARLSLQAEGYQAPDDDKNVFLMHVAIKQSADLVALVQAAISLGERRIQRALKRTNKRLQKRRKR